MRVHTGMAWTQAAYLYRRLSGFSGNRVTRGRVGGPKTVGNRFIHGERGISLDTAAKLPDANQPRFTAQSNGFRPVFCPPPSHWLLAVWGVGRIRKIISGFISTREQYVTPADCLCGCFGSFVS